jgi:opacity protein-like surface antigen
MHPFIAGLTIALLTSAPAVGQPATPPEISGGYFALTAGSDGYPKGYFLDLVANVTSRFGFVFGTDGAYRSESFEYLVLGGRRVQGEGTVILETLPVTIKTTTRGMVAGGRFTWPDPRVRYFAQASVGAAHLSSRADIRSSSESAASLRDAYQSSRWRTAVQAGVGADVAISPRNAVRIGLDYRRVERVPRGFIESEDRGHGPNQLMFAVGVSRMLGG